MSSSDCPSLPWSSMGLEKELLLPKCIVEIGKGVFTKLKSSTMGWRLEGMDVLDHTVHGVLKARILKWFTIPFSSGPHSVRPLSWMAPHGMV